MLKLILCIPLLLAFFIGVTILGIWLDDLSKVITYLIKTALHKKWKKRNLQ